jgi:phage terminase small subunit
LGILGLGQRYEGAEARDRCVTFDRILAEYVTMALFDPAELYDEEGRLLPVHLMPERARRALTGIVEVEEINAFDHGQVPVGLLRKVKFANKTKALDVLAQYLGIIKKPF